MREQRRFGQRSTAKGVNRAMATVCDVERAIELEEGLTVQVLDVSEDGVPTLGICFEGESVTAAIFLTAEGLRRLGEEFVRIAEQARGFCPDGRGR